MNSTAKNVSLGKIMILEVQVTEDFVTAKISDGRTVSVPLSWFPHLLEASQEQRQNFQISPSGYGIHWPEIDEDISIKSFISA